MMKHLTRVGLLCAVMAMGWLLGACGPTPTGAAVEPTPTGTAVTPQTELGATLEAPSSLPNGEAVKLTFTLTNHSPERLYVLTWYTPLEGIFGEIFRVKRDGEAIPYEGPLVMRGDPLPEDYVLLEPGASVSAEVDLATAYDFSQAGQYTIEFLSPRISDVAKTESEFAASVDDLGPVEIPCNSLRLEIANSSASPARRTLAEAAEMIRDYLGSQHPQLNPAVHLPLEELPMPEAWEGLRVQLFRIAEGPFIHEAFLITDDSVLRVGEATGGRGLTSLEISDLDEDGSAELLFTYAFGSGLHQSRIGMYAPAYGPGRTYEAGIGYFGDLGLVKEDKSTVSVRVVESEEAALTLRYLDLLGTLAIEVHGDQAALVLHLAEDLPDQVRDQVFEVTG
jgi:peptidyl-Lys metalloendopeptidase